MNNEYYAKLLEKEHERLNKAQEKSGIFILIMIIIYFINMIVFKNELAFFHLVEIILLFVALVYYLAVFFSVKANINRIEKEMMDNNK